LAQLESGLHEHPRVAGEGIGIARDHRNAPYGACRKLGNLRQSTGAWRVEDGEVEALQLVDLQRILDEVATGGRAATQQGRATQTDVDGSDGGRITLEQVSARGL